MSGALYLGGFMAVNGAPIFVKRLSPSSSLPMDAAPFFLEIIGCNVKQSSFIPRNVSLLKRASIVVTASFTSLIGLSLMFTSVNLELKCLEHNLKRTADYFRGKWLPRFIACRIVTIRQFLICKIMTLTTNCPVLFFKLSRREKTFAY